MTGWTAILAPMAEEIRTLRRTLGNGDDGPQSLRRSLEDRLPWVGFGRMARARVLLAVTGDGAANARRGIDAVLDAAAPERIVIVGVGGALSPSLDLEEVVVAREVRGPDGGSLAVDEATLAHAVETTEARSAVAVTRRTLALSSRAKEDLYAEHGRPDAAVVDMESWHYARAATEARVPWIVLRAVSDEASEDLPEFLNDCLDEGGSVDRGKVARHALFHPSVMPRLLTMKRRVEACSQRLAEHATKLLEAGR